MYTDSLTQATAADLEQILFSQDAPPGFPQEYWTLARRIYDGRRYAPLWVGSESTSEKGLTRMELLCRARDEGIVLPLPFSGTSAVAPAYGRRVDSLAQRDLRRTFALIEYLTIVARGGVSPLAAGVPWNVASPATPSDQTLASLIEASDSAGVARLMPASPQYMRLSHALKRLLDLDSLGGWDDLADSTLLHPGSEGPAVVRLRKRLVRSGDLAAADSSGANYTSAVISGVRSFQRRVGVTPDGRVGPSTRAALNVTTSVRARTVAANMERYRWLPRAPTGQAVILDVASGSAQVSRNGAPVLNTPIHAMSTCRTTVPPLIADNITRVTGNDVTLKVHLVAGDSIVIGMAATHRDASACLIAEDLAALRSALTASTGPNSSAMALYLIWPTAYVASDSILMYRQDATGADARLIAQLPAPVANRSAMCESVAAVY